MSQKKLLEERIIELYNQGLSLQKVANFVGYKSANSVKNILIKYGIQRRGTAGFKEPFKENFFENIDSEEKAYFLGFLMADGNVYVRKQSQPCIRLEISVKDLEILERFKMAIESKNSICFDKRNCCSLKVHSSKKDVESLREYMYNDATIYLKRKYDSCYKIYVNTERD